MDLHQLKTLAAAAELGSLTQAAARLHLSQPAASAQIKALESEFGIKLFERRRSGLTLTPTGAALLPEIRRLLNAADALRLHARQLRGRLSGTVKVAIVSPTVADTSLLRLGEIMKAMVTRHPMLAIEVHNRNSRSIVAGICSREFDAGIALGNRPIPNVRRIPLRELHYRVVAPGTWPQEIRSASWTKIAASPWVSAPRNGSHFQMATDLFRKHHFEPVKVIEADSEAIIASLITAGVGLGLMREDLAWDAQAAGDIHVLNRGRPHTFLELVYHSTRERDPAVQALVAVVREVWCRPIAASGQNAAGGVPTENADAAVRRSKGA
jgi:DNA-binding transcriptional LysR family regulator